jgi:hypothetical protein
VAVRFSLLKMSRSGNDKASLGGGGEILRRGGAAVNVRITDLWVCSGRRASSKAQGVRPIYCGRWNIRRGVDDAPL